MMGEVKEFLEEQEAHIIKRLREENERLSKTISNLSSGKTCCCRGQLLADAKADASKQQPYPTNKDGDNLSVKEFCYKHGWGMTSQIEYLMKTFESMNDMWMNASYDLLYRLATLGGVLTGRERRLFACWCVRQIQHIITDKHLIRGLDIAEQYAIESACQEGDLYGGTLIKNYCIPGVGYCGVPSNGDFRTYNEQMRCYTINLNYYLSLAVYSVLHKSSMYVMEAAWLSIEAAKVREVMRLYSKDMTECSVFHYDEIEKNPHAHEAKIRIADDMMDKQARYLRETFNPNFSKTITEEY